MSDEEWDAMITVGRVIRPHGRRGEVVVVPETDHAIKRFRPGAPLFRLQGAGVAAVEIRSSRALRDRWVVGFAGVGSIEEAESLRGIELKIPAGALPDLGPGGYYTHDLVGCEVETVSGAKVGRVEEVRFGHGAPLLVLQGPDGEVMVPLAEHICVSVDVTGRRIVIDPPDGLIELNRRTPNP